MLRTFKYIAGVFVLMIGATGCKDFVQVDLPITQISTEQAFADDGKAQSSMKGIYAGMQNGWGSGPFTGGLSTLTGLSSDELELATYNAEQQLLFDNNLNENVGLISSNLWAPVFGYMYQINVLYENVAKAPGVTAPVKDALMGEARFLRALNNFYLVNLFDSIPLVITSDYRVNALLPRSAAEKGWELIVDDLKFAQEKMNGAYTEKGVRIRANRFAGYALMARVQLYLEHWKDAEDQATLVINAGPYKLDSLGGVFLYNSTESILNMANSGVNLYTVEGGKVAGSTSVTYRFSDVTKAAFEPGDLRWQKWVRTSGTVAGPFKYKVFSNTDKTKPAEWVPILRLAEQYLIRAEARAMQDKLPGAIADVDSIRKRAGLPLISATNPNISKADLLKAIEKERQTELFAEFGHRFLDVKRRHMADITFAANKKSWNKYAAFYPVPFTERQRNPNLGQNQGY